jgi:hypothetical protein
MNALDRILAASSERACEACRHARGTAGDGLYCHRTAASPCPCQVERASATLEAWVYGACGRYGRYFEEARPTAAPVWTPRGAERRNVTAERA